MKITKAAQQARKAAIRAYVVQRQAQNTVTKANLAAAYQTQVDKRKAADPDYKESGQPRGAGNQQPDMPGYRADGRKKGFRLQKQPRTPKAQVLKGAPRTEAHERTQAAALFRINTGIQGGRVNFVYAADQQRRTVNMPARQVRFASPGGTQTVSGKDCFEPKVFENNPQGTRNNRHKPLPKMKGEGTEFPVTTNQGGYQDAVNPGRFRVITQTKRNNNHKFKGVVAHDEHRPTTHLGYHDHFQSRQIPRPATRNRMAAILPFMRPILNPEGAVGSATGY